MADKGSKLPGHVHCAICNVFVSSVGLLETHNKGKKHQQMLKLRDEQAIASKLSVYVRGFNASETSEDELKEFFRSHGDVKNIYFDKNKGRFAIVEFEDQEAVSSILKSEEPFIFKGKSLKIKERTFSNHMSKERSIKGESSNASVQKRKRKYSKTASSFLSDALITKINQASTVTHQIDLLIQEIKLTEADLDLRSLICKILKEVFQEFIPSCDVNVFGSSATGLGCSGSDLDITLLMDTNTDTWLIDLDDSLDGCSTDAKSHDAHSFVVKVLRTLVPGCSNIIPIFSAKCPVIKFSHQSTGISCDLTINNRLGLQNTSLLKCYMELDPRVPQITYTIRAWATLMGISGGSGQLTNYALTIMVLNYLQSTDPPVIPCLQDIANWPLVEYSEYAINEENVDGWFCGFYKKISNLCPSLNDNAVGELLLGFFDFYSKFEFGNYAVTIRKKDDFSITALEEEIRQLPSQFSENDVFSNSSWKTSPLNVQDPFELTHNLTQSIGDRTLQDIVQYMIDAKNICKTWFEENQLSMSSQDKGIIKLFKYCPKQTAKR